MLGRIDSSWFYHAFFHQNILYSPKLVNISLDWDIAIEIYSVVTAVQPLTVVQVQHPDSIYNNC